MQVDGKVRRGLIVTGLIFALGTVFWLSRHFALRNSAKEISPWGFNNYQKLTGDSAEEDRGRWDRLFSTENYVYGKEPSAFLREHLDLVPKGRALDIAMGEGRNAVFLAKRGFVVEGVDYSDVALRKAARLARENRVAIQTINADLTRYSIPKRTYELIVNIHFHEASLIPKIREGLKPGGVVVYEMFMESLDGVTSDLGESSALSSAGGTASEGRVADQQSATVQSVAPKIAKDQPFGKVSSGLADVLLRPGELRSFFSDFEILVYRESLVDGKPLAQLVARRPD